MTKYVSYLTHSHIDYDDEVKCESISQS